MLLPLHDVCSFAVFGNDALEYGYGVPEAAHDDYILILLIPKREISKAVDTLKHSFPSLVVKPSDDEGYPDSVLLSTNGRFGKPPGKHIIVDENFSIDFSPSIIHIIPDEHFYLDVSNPDNLQSLRWIPSAEYSHIKFPKLVLTLQGLLQILQDYDDERRTDDSEIGCVVGQMVHSISRTIFKNEFGFFLRELPAHGRLLREAVGPQHWTAFDERMFPVYKVEQPEEYQHRDEGYEMEEEPTFDISYYRPTFTAEEFRQRYGIGMDLSEPMVLVPPPKHRPRGDLASGTTGLVKSLSNGSTNTNDSDEVRTIADGEPLAGQEIKGLDANLMCLVNS